MLTSNRSQINSKAPVLIDRPSVTGGSGGAASARFASRHRQTRVVLHALGEYTGTFTIDATLTLRRLDIFGKKESVGGSGVMTSAVLNRI